MKIPLTPEQRAIVLAGGNEIDIGELTPAQGTTATTPAAAPAASTTAAPTPPAPAAPAAAPAPSAEVINFVQAQLADSNAKLLAANVKIAQLEAAAQTSAAHLPALVEIAQAACGQMQVAMGAADTAKGLDAAAVVAEHARVKPLFEAKFPGGRISAVPKTPETEATTVEGAAAFAERLSAAAR